MSPPRILFLFCLESGGWLPTPTARRIRFGSFLLCLFSPLLCHCLPPSFVSCARSLDSFPLSVPFHWSSARSGSMPGKNPEPRPARVPHPGEKGEKGEKGFSLLSLFSPAFSVRRARRDGNCTLLVGDQASPQAQFVAQRLQFMHAFVGGFFSACAVYYPVLVLPGPVYGVALLAS